MSEGTDSPAGDAGRLGAPSFVRWRIVLLLMAFSFMAHFNRICMSAAGDAHLREEFGISETQMGFVYSAFLFTYTAFMTPGGCFVDHYGAKAALIIMGLASGVFCALTGSLGFGLVSAGLILPALLVVRGVMGVFNSPIYPAAGRIVSAWVPFSQRALANGLVIGAAPIGDAVPYVVFGALMDSSGWPAAFMITGSVTGVIALVWAIYGKNRPDQHPTVNAAELTLIQKDATDGDMAAKDSMALTPWWTLFKNRSLVLLTISYAASGYFEYIFNYWIHHYFESVLKLGSTASHYYAAIPPLALALGMPLGGAVCDRLQGKYGLRVARSVVAVVGLLAAGSFLCLGLLVTDTAWVLIWFALAMGSMGAFEASTWATAIELGGSRGGTSAGIVNTGGNVGGIVSPIVTPWVSQYLGWQWGVSLGAVACLFGVLLWFWIDPGERLDETASSGKE